MKIIILLIPLLFCGCIGPAGNDLNMHGILGKHSSELVAVRGLPNQRHPDGQGGEIWVYQANRHNRTQARTDVNYRGTAIHSGLANSQIGPYGGINTRYGGNSYYQGNATATTTPSVDRSYTATRSFAVDKNGIVRRYWWQGL